MPRLEWDGKKAVENYHLQVPYHVLREETELSAGGEAGAGNLLVQGDNLVALKALLPYYRGQVKCIYIDPPYNTGNEGWVYNDNVNSPVIKEWLGKVVGKESEDFSRHDKWLCMMYPRLRLARSFLAKDGVLFVSIDDTELPYLRMILDEFFPHAEAKNRLACFAWQTEGNFDNQAKIKISHEYVLAYSRSFEDFPAPAVIDLAVAKSSKLYRSAIQNTIVKNGPKNPVSELVLPVGFPASIIETIIPARKNKWPHYDEDLVIRNEKLQKAVVARSGWSSKEIIQEFIDTGFQSVLDSKGQRTTFVLTQTGAIEAIKQRSENQSHVVSVLRGAGSTQQASQQLGEMGIAFDYPKPTSLIMYLIAMVSDRSSIVLDFFAGSGTTGNAVSQLNSDDGGNRRFILVEMESAIAESITAKRLRMVLEGYKKADGSDVPGLGGGFRFLTLGEPIFNADGTINPAITFPQLARHVWFEETRQPLPADAALESPFLGVSRAGVGVYLLFNGILKDRRVNGGNVLTRRLLATLPPHAGPKMIYAAGCRLDAAQLREAGITFKQTPYQITGASASADALAERTENSAP